MKPEQYLTPRNPSNSSCSNCRMVDYFKNVDPKMLSELKQVYKVDFEMFGYDFNVWWRKIDIIFTTKYNTV